jgi:hypothetical protein
MSVSTDTGIKITTNSGAKVTLFPDRLVVEIGDTRMQFYHPDASTMVQFLLLEGVSDLNRTLDAMQVSLNALERKA